MDPTHSGATKRELLEGLLEKGVVLVHLDARSSGVDVPAEFRDDADLRLNLSYRYQGRLEILEHGIEATLSFSGSPYPCALPFDSVYAMLSHCTGEGYFFPADAPAQALEALAALVAGASESDDEKESEPERPALVALDGGADETAEGEAEAEPVQVAETASGRGGHLRLVK